ncbi:CRAL-TRIO lipid binding domain containing protein [Parasponia andersonii]|uniref:CRAL-TRIO lipid binding domain containing protein n=1 Tax=Parasponia andersonii TaxID=3476 RepID=A0A2P5CNN3_PARAD|nr:CRAL-TRIO lipid binding domain containing protein [Parasponia andersonii]
MAAGASPREELQTITMAEKSIGTHVENGHDETENGGNEKKNIDQDDDDDDEFESIAQGDHEELSTTLCVDQMNRRKKKALLEFRWRVEDAISGNYLLGKPNEFLSRNESIKQREILRETTLWGVPLLPSKAHEGTDIVLLKFLKAKDFKVHEAFQMLRRTLKWRKEYKSDEILDEKLGPSSDIEQNKVLYFNSRDKEGRPVCYNVYEAFGDRDFYREAFGSEDKCEEFLRWRIQFIEKGINKLSFKNGGVHSIVQITDLKNSPGPAMKELHSVSKKALVLLQENYPELVHKNIVINAPLWYYAVHIVRSRFLTQKTKRKFVLARPTNVTKTLLKFIAPENLPVQYGGLKREHDEDFSTLDEASELKIKGNSTAYIKFPVSEAGSTMVWDFTVVGWEVSYKEEFIPDDEGSYKILLQNQKRVGESVRNSFYISEPGTIVITIDNGNYKKKTVLYRSKAKPTVPMYILFKN